MPPASKGRNWKTTIYSTYERRDKLRRLAEKRARENGTKASDSFSDLFNEGIDKMLEYDNDLEGSKVALAYGVEGKISEGLAVLGVLLMVILRLLLEQSKHERAEYLPIIDNYANWGATSYSRIAGIIIKQRRAQKQAERAANEWKRQQQVTAAEQSRHQRAREEAERKHLDSDGT